jgi:hypothetical protein
VWGSWRPLLAGATAGGGVAYALAGLGGWSAQAPLFFLAGAAGGATAAVAAARLLRTDPPCPIGARLKGIPEVRAVYARGYEICFRRGRPSRRFQRWVFSAHLRGRAVGRLDADFIQAKRRLYVANVHVVETHGKRGLGAALFLCAARKTGCEAVTTSGRTRPGARLVDKCRPLLRSYGIEIYDTPLLV